MCQYRYQMNYSCGHGYYFTPWTSWAACTDNYYSGELDDHEAEQYTGDAGLCLSCFEEAL